jgi:two-component system sensor histidine kinase CpxA
VRGLVVKIFVCSALVQVIAHGVWITMAVLFAAQVPGSARLLAHAVPLYAELGRATLEREGPAALATLLQRAEKAGDLRLEVRQGSGTCKPDLAMGPMALAAGDERFCLIARPSMPRGLHLWPDGMLLVQLAVCLLFSYGLARYLLQPIRVLSVAAEALGRGDLTARAGPKLGRRCDEAGALVRQFDRMAERIALLIQSQQRFIGDVSHEIKSPLARLTMAIGLARRETNGLAAARFDRMEDEIEAVSGLIRELLTLSSLQARDVADRSGLVDLDALVRGVIDDAGFEWRHRQGDIRLHMADPGVARVRVRGDATLLRRAFENVLRNALFYTPPGTVVNVIITQTGAHVTLLVQDQGPGVPPDALERLFDPFYRVDDARARNTGGVGIGLAICERAVRLHGGAVRARNVSPSGLAVSLELPCEAREDVLIA